MTRADALIVAGMAVSTAAFMFCVIASVAYGWHTAATKPGIVVALVAMVACVLVARLRGDGQ